MLVDKQRELMSDILFTVHRHGGDDVTWFDAILTIAVLPRKEPASEEDLKTERR